MLITDQVATAPCTDRIQVRFPTYEANPCAANFYPRRLKNCTCLSCFSAASRVSKVPRFFRFLVFGSTLREYSRYLPDFNFLIICFGLQKLGG